VGFLRRTAEDRAVEQWRRTLEAGLEQPLDPDALAPSTHRLVGWLPPVEPPRGSRRARRARGPLLPGLLVVLALMAFVAISHPGSTTYWTKELVRRATGADSTSYAFMRTTTSDGRPVAWDGCRPIHYRVSPALAPDGWQDLVDDAVAEVSEASGYAFVDDGVTDDREFLDRRPGAPVLIGWGEPSEYGELVGDVAGFGGATSLVVDGRARYVTGEVLLDSGDYARMEAGGRGEAMRLVLVHELLHVVGLDHVEDRRQLMYPSYHGQGGLGAGDREGLRVLRDQPCA